MVVKKMPSSMNAVPNMEDIDPHSFTYEELKLHTKQNGLTIEDVFEKMKISSSTARKYAERNNGVIGYRYFYVLVGMIALRKQSTLKIPD